MARGYDEPFTLYGLIARRSKPTPSAATSPSSSIRPRDSPTASRSPRTSRLLLAAPARQGPTQSPHLLREGRQGRGDRRARRALRSFRQQRPRAAADPRAHAGAVKHAIDPETFEETSLRAAARQRALRRRPRSIPARASRFKRNPDYWGRDLPVNRGLWNFDEIRFDYYREANSHIEAFKRGLFDLRTEHDPTRWQTAYDFPAVRDGRVVKESVPDRTCRSRAVYFVFNTRRPIFAECASARSAARMLFDFEWINHSYFFDLYRRTRELFRRLGTVVAWPAGGCARDGRCSRPSRRGARRTCSRAHGRLPVSDGSGRDRTSASGRSTLFAAAGYELRGAELVERSERRGRSPSRSWSRRATRSASRSCSAQSLKRAGIAARVRVVDAVQFEGRRAQLRFRHDREPLGPIAVARQRAGVLLGLGSRRSAGTRNYMGVKSPAVDAMIAALLKARNARRFRRSGARARPRADLRVLHHPAVSLARAMDRALDAQSGVLRRPRSTGIFPKPGGTSRNGRDRGTGARRAVDTPVANNGANH